MTTHQIIEIIKTLGLEKYAIVAAIALGIGTYIGLWLGLLLGLSLK